MSNELIVKKSVRIKASRSDVWEALTNPEITKKYFFNCEALSDWQVGSPVEFTTTVDGAPRAVVKGIVTAIERNALLEHTCYSAEFEHVPSQHTTVAYSLRADDDATTLSVTQGSFRDEAAYGHTDASWNKVLDGLRTVLEKPRP